MLNRCQDQAHSRRGYALVGVIFLLFGLIMLFIDSGIGAFLGIFFGCILLLPALFFSYTHFQKYEKILSWVSILGNWS